MTHDEITEMGCPDHGIPYFIMNTKYGRRANCPVDGCTVVWWIDKDTSMPANKETRIKRREAHVELDILWKSGEYDRNRLYRSLSLFLGIPRKETHIGTFDVEMCEKTIEFAKLLK